jgi:hypothetical protein
VGAVSAKPDMPDASRIAAHSKAVLLSGQVSRQTTIQALRLMEENLRRDFDASSEALRPITDLIEELQTVSVDVQNSHP